ncbi:ATPase [Solibacillus isronensis]|uniref:ATPase n=1 Tax=Solibacillus isronensis TaxID=412383 RepID=UPI00203E9471|nr:ATPase [Solibacillus isronensis]MCM3720828.1 ATPase [Solibacillus isronensis]
MQAKIDKADCMFLISDETMYRFQQLIDELNLFTLILPFSEESYQRSVIIFDIWYLLSTEEIDRISNPENTMIYPIRKFFLDKIKTFQIRRYIQLALLENEKLAFICAIYIYLKQEQFIVQKLAENEEVAANFQALKGFSSKSLRPYYDSKYIEVENYPQQLALLQSTVLKELQVLVMEFETSLLNLYEQGIAEASEIYEAVFGLINDWGGRVT